MAYLTNWGRLWSNIHFCYWHESWPSCRRSGCYCMPFWLCLENFLKIPQFACRSHKYILISLKWAFSVIVGLKSRPTAHVKEAKVLPFFGQIFNITSVKIYLQLSVPRFSLLPGRSCFIITFITLVIPILCQNHFWTHFGKNISWHVCH